MRYHPVCLIPTCTPLVLAQQHRQHPRHQKGPYRWLTSLISLPPPPWGREAAYSVLLCPTLSHCPCNPCLPVCLSPVCLSAPAQVTQPRRISAISVAERIAEERAEKIGQVSGA